MLRRSRASALRDGGGGGGVLRKQRRRSGQSANAPAHYAMWPAWRGVRRHFADPAGLIVALERLDPTLLSKAEAARVELCVADHGHNKENAAQVDVLAAGLATLKKRVGAALAAMAYLTQRLRAVLAEYHDFHRQRLLAEEELQRQREQQ